MTVLAGGCDSRGPKALAPPQQPARAFAPAATLISGDLPDGKPRVVDGIRVTPFRIVADSGLSSAQCGVLIGGQRVLTLGADDLDAYTCDGLRDAHALPGHQLGLLYDAQSPNTRLRTAALLRRDGAGRWTVVPAATTTYDNLPVKSWAAFVAALKHS